MIDLLAPILVALLGATAVVSVWLAWERVR